VRTPPDDYFSSISRVVATRATCLRRSVGCVLVNVRGHILSTGYNGRAAGLPHCDHHDPFHETGYPFACGSAFSRSGTDLDGCEAIHAEQNALLQCRDVWAIETCYVTTSPCLTCVKLLMNTSCRRIAFEERYAHDEEASRLWLSMHDREWVDLMKEKKDDH
jgi:dCMP deaminase